MFDVKFCFGTEVVLFLADCYDVVLRIVDNAPTEQARRGIVGNVVNRGKRSVEHKRCDGAVVVGGNCLYFEHNAALCHRAVVKHVVCGLADVHRLVVVPAVAASDRYIVTVGIVDAVKQQNRVAHHFEARHAVESLVEIVSLDGDVLAVCKSVLVFSGRFSRQIVIVGRRTRCADGVFRSGFVGIGYRQFCRTGQSCPACAAAVDVESDKRCAVLLPQSKQSRVGGKCVAFDILRCKFVGLLVHACPPTLEGVALTLWSGHFEIQFAVYRCLACDLFGCVVAEIERNVVFLCALGVLHPLGVQRGVCRDDLGAEVEGLAAEIGCFVPTDKFVAVLSGIGGFTHQSSVYYADFGCALTVVKRYGILYLLVEPVHGRVKAQLEDVILILADRSPLPFDKRESNLSVFCSSICTRRQRVVLIQRKRTRSAESQRDIFVDVNALFRTFFDRRSRRIIVCHFARSQYSRGKTADQHNGNKENQPFVFSRFH